MDAPYVVMDVGSGLSKLGWAGNLQPSFTIPTVLATRQHDSSHARSAAHGLEDFDAFIGEDALNNNSKAYSLSYPVRQSVVEDWDALERFYQHCLFSYLRVEPEDHCMMLSQPLGASTEARQQLAEIMFETFGVAGIYMGLQAVLSLYAAVGVHRESAALSPPDVAIPSDQQQTTAPAPAAPAVGPKKPAVPWRHAAAQVLAHGLDPYSITGVVVDVGEGSTSVIPVMDGFVARSSARCMGVGGRDLTHHVQQAIRSCGAGVPPDMSWDVARKVKESQCYVCADPDKEPARLAARAAAASGGGAGRKGKTYTVVDARAGHKEIIVPLGPELFTAHEVLFTSPPASTGPPAGMMAQGAGGVTNRTLGGWQPLPELVDRVVQSCPIDARRPLYSTVALSGGTTCTRNFDRRIKTDLSTIANGRLPPGARAIDVDVLTGPWAQHAAWLGGSLLAGGAAPAAMVAAATTTRQHWQEHGSLLEI